MTRSLAHAVSRNPRAVPEGTPTRDDLSVVHALVRRARDAQAQVDTYSQEAIDDVCRAVAWQVYRDDHVATLAERAVAETGMGVVDHKKAKHKYKVLGALRDALAGKTVGLVEEDVERGIRKYAKPVGVVGALTPVTNATVTPASNAIAILKGRNAVVFAPHPRAAGAAGLACECMRKGLRAVDAPEDLIQCVPAPTPARSRELMRQVDLVLATGGQGMVRAAYSSGTPAYGVGAGNAVVIVAEDADVEDAAAKVFASKTFDNATSCSSESSVIVHARVYDRLIAALLRRKAHLCDAAEKGRLQAWMWDAADGGTFVLNRDVVAAPAARIARDAGLDVPDDTTLLIVACDASRDEGPWQGEKLSPVLALWRYDDFDEALDIQRALTRFAGLGHSSGIHTFHRDYIERLSRAARVGRIMVRQPMAQANGGNFFNGMPASMSLGCGAWGGNITSDNIHWRHFINLTWVSEPIQPVRPTDEEVWGAFWQKYGK